jgi:hypothetical protein
VPHARYQKQPDKALRLPRHPLIHGLIPVNRIVGREHSVGVAMTNDHLPTMFLKCREVGGTRVMNCIDDCL